MSNHKGAPAAQTCPSVLAQELQKHIWGKEQSVRAAGRPVIASCSLHMICVFSALNKSPLLLL